MQIPLSEIARLFREADAIRQPDPRATYDARALSARYPDGVPVTRRDIAQCLSVCDFGQCAEVLIDEFETLSQYVATRIHAFDDRHIEHEKLDFEDGAGNLDDETITARLRTIHRAWLRRIVPPTVDMLAYAIEQGQLATI